MNQATWPLAAPAALAPALALALALAGCGENTPDKRTEPAAPSSEWVEPNPTEPAVPVDLPKTPMTNAPASEAAPAAK